MSARIASTVVRMRASSSATAAASRPRFSQRAIGSSSFVLPPLRGGLGWGTARSAVLVAPTLEAASRLIPTPLALLRESALPFGEAAVRRSKIHAVAALELQDLAGLVRGRDLEAEALDDLARLHDLRRVRFGELAGPDPERVLEPDAHVAAHRGRHGGDRQLVA